MGKRAHRKRKNRPRTRRKKVKCPDMPHENESATSFSGGTLDGENSHPGMKHRIEQETDR